jgi:hypothetical protein
MLIDRKKVCIAISHNTIFDSELKSQAWKLKIWQDSNYVRRGDAFPTVERRGYLAYKRNGY